MSEDLFSLFENQKVYVRFEDGRGNVEGTVIGVSQGYLFLRDAQDEGYSIPGPGAFNLRMIKSIEVKG